MTLLIAKLYSDSFKGILLKEEFIVDKNKIKDINEFIDAMIRENMLTMSDAEIINDKKESNKVDINIPPITIHIQEKTLLDNTTFKKYHMVEDVLMGGNGVGKKTLLNLIAKKEIEDIKRHILKYKLPM